MSGMRKPTPHQEMVMLTSYEQTMYCSYELSVQLSKTLAVSRYSIMRWYRNIRRRIGLSKAKMHRVKANTGGRRNIPSRQELDRMTHAVDVRIDQGVYSNYCGLCSDKVALFGLDETGQTNDKHYCVLSSILPIPGIPIDEYSEPMTHQGTPGDHNENPSYRGYRDAEIKPDGIDDSAYIPMHITPLGNPIIPHYLTPCFSENIRSLCKLPIPYPKYT